MWAMGQAIIASNVRVPASGDPASRARTRSGRRDGEEEAEWLDQVGCPGLVDEGGVTQRHMREDLAFEQLGPEGRHRGHFETSNVTASSRWSLGGRFQHYRSPPLAGESRAPRVRSRRFLVSAVGTLLG
jgi:hypothetical protein